jgi:hypothetical protein
MASNKDVWLAMDANSNPLGIAETPAGTPPTQQSITASTPKKVPPATRKALASLESPISSQAALPFGFQQYTNRPEDMQVLNEYTANQARSQEQQQQGVNQYEQLLKEHLAKSVNPQLDLSPLMALSDTWYGGNLAQNYKRPTDSKANLQTTVELQQGLQKAKDALTDNQASTLKTKMNYLQQADQTALNALMAQARDRETQRNAGENRDFKDTKLNIDVKKDYRKNYGENIRGTASFTAHANDAYEILKRNGGTIPMTGADKAAYDTATSRMSTDYNKYIAGLGALAGSDLALINQGLGVDESIMGTFLRQGVKGGGKATMDGLQQIMDRNDAVLERARENVNEEYGGLANKAFEIDYETVKKARAGKLGGGSPTPDSVGQDVLDYAKNYGITPEQALAIKKKRGG